MLLVLLLLCLLAQCAGEGRFPIVFVYTVMPSKCAAGLPEYIRISLEQSIFTQSDCDVILLANIGECSQISDTIRDIKGLTVVDSTALASERTKSFLKASGGIFVKDQYNDLWVTSASRFFALEDMMLARGYSELLHAEADNMLYGPLTAVLPVLRAHYPLAVNPLTVAKSYFTASVFWVSSQSRLVEFNDFLIALSTNGNGAFDAYLDWLRPHGARRGGLRPDARGMGVPQWMVNEMTMLAFYHNQHPAVLGLLPSVPPFPFPTNRHIPDLNKYSPTGSDILSATGMAVWDPGSWGQFIGGTFGESGKDKGFTDGSHIGGLAMRFSQCKPYFSCGNFTEYAYVPDAPRSRAERCYSLPFIDCGEGHPPTPLWNLHVHSKHTAEFRSELCACNKH